MNKGIAYLVASIGGLAGSWLGSLLDHGGLFSVGAILGGLVGGIAGLYIVYKVQQ